jgi:hypothetical protein
MDWTKTLRIWQKNEAKKKKRLKEST